MPQRLMLDYGSLISRSALRLPSVVVYTHQPHVYAYFCSRDTFSFYLLYFFPFYILYSLD